MSNEYVENEQRKKKSSVKKTITFFAIFYIVLFGFFAPMVVYESPSPIEFYTDVLGRMTSEKLSGTVYLKNVPIYLEGDTGFTQYDLDKWTKEVPDALLQNCTGIYICQKGTNSTCDKVLATRDWSDANSQNPIGFVISEDNNVYLYVNRKSALIHELMHLYNRMYGLDASQQVIDLYTNCSAYLNSNAKFNASEFLSESATLYFTNPQQIQTQSLQPVYDYFQSLFHYYS